MEAGLDALTRIVPVLVTGAIAWYSLHREGAREVDRRHAEAGRLALEFALRRKFELVERIADGTGRWEGLLQSSGNLRQPWTPEGRTEVERLTGGWQEWGRYRAAARELGDPTLAGACIGLGNSVLPLLSERDDLEPGTYTRWEQGAYERLGEVWSGLTRIRTDLERELGAIGS